MAVSTAPPKQTLHNQPALIALGNSVRLLPQHTRPFRRRHIVLLILAILAVILVSFELAAVVARQSLDPRTLFTEAATKPTVQTESVVKSSNGFTLSYNNQQFTVAVHGEGADEQTTTAELDQGNALSSVTLTPLPSRVPAPEAAATLEIRSEVDAAAFAAFKLTAPRRTDMSALLANYFAPKPTDSADITEQSRTTESINGTLMTKAVYLVAPKFAGNPTHSIIWTAEVAGKPLAIIISGVMVGSGTPSSMAPIMQSMQLESATKVNGLSIVRTTNTRPEIDQKYVADLVSPATVKIYHLICGTLEFNGRAMSDDTCNGTTGSGFLVSSDGYVATNGHVVVYSAKDMLVNALLSNDKLLEQFLSGTALTSTQITEIMSRADLTASVVSKIYDLPDSQLRLANQREVTVVATGDKPLDIGNADSVRKLVDTFRPTSSLKQATIEAYDYSAKDKLTVIANPDEGFSSSDVALLKINVQHAPFVRFAISPVHQNQEISVFGFPSDADNQLTDNRVLGVSATNGTISSVRDAAGSNAKLYQSDVDASHGNSGGPAVDETGRVFGLLTYRFSSGDAADAAKSYIRDISDFTNLLRAHKVSLSGDTQTQLAWEKGLDLYSKQHYSAALAQFRAVQKAYPNHRLASTYIDYSNTAIQQGKDVKDPSLALLVIGLIAALAVLAAAVMLIARHHGRHQVYRTYHRHKVAVSHG